MFLQINFQSTQLLMFINNTDNTDISVHTLANTCFSLPHTLTYNLYDKTKLSTDYYHKEILQECPTIL